MKQQLKKHLILILLVLIGIFAALGILAGRIQQEESNKYYDIVIDFSSLQEMAEASDQPLEYWLEFFHDLGVDKLCVRDATVEKLAQRAEGNFYMSSIEDIRQTFGWEDQYPEEVAQWILDSERKDDVVAVSTDAALTAWVEEAFSQRYDGEIVVFHGKNGSGYFCLAGSGKITGEMLSELSLGTLPEYAALAESCGYTLVPRTVTIENLNSEKFLRDIISDYEAANVPYMIGGGAAIPGYDDPETAQSLLLEYLDSNEVTLGVIETSDQSMNLNWSGLSELVSASDYNAVRLFSMWDYIQWRYQWYNYDGPEEITNSLYRAAYERNCRLIFLKMILKSEDDQVYITEPEAYESLIGDFTARMEQGGYTMKTLSSAGNHTVSPVLLILVAVGAIAAAMLLLLQIIPLRPKYTYLLTAAGCLCAAVVLYVMPNTGRLILSMGGGIALPSLAIVALAAWTNNSKVHRSSILWGTLAAAGIAFIGSLFASAPLSDSSYMLEMQLYRGVKIMQLMPLVVFVCYCLKVTLWDNHLALPELEAGSRKQQRKTIIQDFMELPVRMKTLLFIGAGVVVLALVAAVGYYYLARTGHSDGVEAATLELQFRNFLEYYLPARPRTKEFLIGYPCLMLYIWAKRKDIPLLPFFLGLGGVIGLTSIVNTFLHIRTAFMLSLIRTAIGLGFGLVVGGVAVLAAELIYRQIKKRTCHV